MTDSLQSIVAGRYVLLETLGHGGMGSVYRAQDRLTGDQVALKRVKLREDNTSEQSMDVRLALAQEFRLLATLRHPNVIQVLDYGFDTDGAPFFTMNLLQGAHDILSVARNLTLSKRIELINEALMALAYLHRRGIVHRDLKPENLLIVNDHVQVLDFGISAGQDVMGVSASGTISGTLTYVSPEQIRGYAARPASDLYAIGVILYQIFSGRHPFIATDSAQLIYDVLNTEPDLTRVRPGAKTAMLAAPVVIAALRMIIGKLLAKAPGQRYQHASEVVDALCNALDLPIPGESAAIRESFLLSARFVGREEELMRLREGLAVAEHQNGALWLIGGESGVGKSRLLEELRAWALVRGVLVARGQAVAEGGLPFQIWREPMRRIALTAELTDQEAGVLLPYVPDLPTLLERDIPAAPPLEMIPARQRLAQTLLDILRRVKQPVLVLLEDLQWTVESLDLLRDIVPGLAATRTLVVGTWRDDEIPSFPDSFPGAEVMRLKRFGSRTIAELSRAILGEMGAREEVVEFLMRETEGNVFFVIEVVRTLAEKAGSLDSISVDTRSASVLAGGMRAVFQRRLDVLSPAVRDLLKIVAVQGRQIDPALMTHWVEPGFDMEGWLTACANAAVLEFVDGFWRFTHDKLRETLRAELDEEELPRLSRRVAQAIEATYPEDAGRASALAEHWLQAGDRRRHLHYLLKAARQMRLISRYDECQSMCLSALEMLTAPTDQRMSTLALLADSYWDTSAYQKAQKAYLDSLRIARRLNHADGSAAALIGLGAVNWRQGNLEEAVQYYGEGLALAERADSIDLLADALNGIGVVYFDQGRLEASRQHLEKALSLAKRGSEQWRVARTLNNLSNTINYAGDVTTARDYCQLAYALFKKIGDRRNAAYTVLNLGAILEQMREYAAARVHYEEGVTIFRMLGNPWGLAASTSNLGAMLELEGDLAPARAHQLRALDLARQLGDAYLICAILCNVSGVLVKLQDYDNASRMLLELIETAQEKGLRPLELEALSIYARMLLQQGQFGQSAELCGLLSKHLHPAAAEKRLRPLLVELSHVMPSTALRATVEVGITHDVAQTIANAAYALRKATS